MAQESWNREETDCQPPEGPILCTNNCGFFGSKATMNLCSKCYRDIVLAQAKVSSSVQAALEKSIQTELNLVSHTTVINTEAAAADDDVSQSSSSGNLQRPPANRCFTCNKRVGLTGFKCRCSDVFCNLHRYSDKHNCSFDYKAAGRDAITKSNPVVKASKIDKI